MGTLKQEAPIIFSRKFWGLGLFIVLSYLQAKNWIGGLEFEYATQLVGLATGVGILDSVARKLGPERNAASRKREKRS